MNEAGRKPMSKKTRFEVFKRDSFTCQYCGAKAPDVILNVDHIHPVAEGGTDDLLNLVTACYECNSGKGARLLSDDSAVSRQRDQMQQLAAKREQTEMMIEWREALRESGDRLLEYAVSVMQARMSPFVLNDNGRRNIQKTLNQYGFSVLMDAIEAATTQYLQFNTSGVPVQDSVEKCLSMVPKIASVKSGNDPAHEAIVKQTAYLRAVVRNRLEGRYFDGGMAWRIISKSLSNGVKYEDLLDFCKQVKNWSHFKAEIPV